MIDVADLRAWLGNPSEANVDTILTALELRAVEIVQRETGRYFGEVGARTEFLRGNGTNALRLRENPAAITSVESRTAIGEAWVAIAAGDSDGWELRAPYDDARTAQLLRKAGWRWSEGREYRIVYSFGYDAGAEPEDVRQAVMDVVDYLYRGRSRKGLKSEDIGDYSWEGADGSIREEIMIAAGHASTLNKWRGLVYA